MAADAARLQKLQSAQDVLDAIQEEHDNEIAAKIDARREAKREEKDAKMKYKAEKKAAERKQAATMHDHRNAAIGALMEAEGAAALRAAMAAAEPLRGAFAAVAEALEAAVERLRLAEEEERAAAKAQHIAGYEEEVLAMQVERAMADGGAGSSSGAGPSGARAEVEVPEEYLCPITSEIMTDPVVTVRHTICCPARSAPHAYPLTPWHRRMASRTSEAPSSAGSRTTTPTRRLVRRSSPSCSSPTGGCAA